ncbi:MAG: hypothetical protein H8E03_00035 [Pelagibacteraceae bacterium]|nr:hypothetical protein [Pelagibacteraceae bacterium]
MNIVDKYRGGNAIPDLEVVEFWNKVLKDDLNKVINIDHYSFPNTGEMFVDTFDQYIKSSTLNKLTGLDTYSHKSFVAGTSQTFDSFWMRNHDRRFRCFKAEFFYHNANWKKFHAWNYIEDDEIKSNDAVVISFPFSDYGKEHPKMRQVLDECERLNVPVLIDCAYYVIARGLNFDFTEYECVEDITFSLSKGFHLSNRIRGGIRYTKKYYDDNIHIMNEWKQYSHISAYFGTKLLEYFPSDFSMNKYRDKQIEFCNTHNLTPSDCVIFALETTGDKYKELNRGTEINRLCISYQIGDDLK